MPNYLETIYFTEEYDPEAYPQKLCNYIFQEYFKDYIVRTQNKKPTLLDIGSGKGNHLVGFGRLGVEASGIDKRDECLTALEKFDIRECDIEKDPFPFEDNTFDFAFSKSVLEHVTNTDNFLTQTLRVLKPGGIAVMMTPDWRSQRNYFWDDYTHVKPFTRKSLQNALKINGFDEVDSRLFLQLPLLWQYPLLEPLRWLVALLPDQFRWKDHEERTPRKWVRFSKEKMLLAVGMKPLKSV